MNKKRQSGQTLIEVLVALAASVVIIGAITVASLSSLNNAQFSRDQSAATHFAQQGLEIIRNMRDFSVASLSASLLPPATYCLAKSCKALDKNNPSCWQKNIECGQNVDTFVREVVIDYNDSSCDPTVTNDVKATVTVFWNDSRCGLSSNVFCHSVIVSSCFSDFTIVPTP
jgi:type II secretory pathway pseudopilin PulG